MLRVYINSIVTEELLDTGTDMTILTLESLHLNCPFQEADVQFLGRETLSQVKQSTRWVECIGPEGQ